MHDIQELRGRLRPTSHSFKKRHRRLHKPRPAPPKPTGPSSLESSELPESYGIDKVVVLPVNPYLVHVYWDLSPHHQSQPSTSACLRFSEAGGPDSFDVKVDLGAKSWYVPLWSPDKRYSVELGRNGPAGEFVSLARSNPVETPRAWPVAEVHEEFQRAGNAGPVIEIPPPPPATPPVAVVGRTPWSARVALDPPAEPSSATEPSDITGHSAAPDVPTAETRPLPPPDAATVLRERLTELYALRWWRDSPAAVSSSAASELPLPARRLLLERFIAGRLPANLIPAELLPARPEVPGDLTERVEHHFSPGFSSSLLALHEPDRPAD